jgi:hypothetical protein
MAGRELVWIPPDGSEFRLTDAGNGYRVTKGVSGLLAPPVQLTMDDTPLEDGGFVTDVYAPPRTGVIPVLILATDRDTYRQRAKALVAAMSRGRECALELRQADGQRRRITAWYNGGLEGLEDKDTGGETWYRCVIRVLCPDPFWFDPTPITLTYEFSGGDEPFLGDPFLPFELTPGEILGATTIHNPGDVRAYPVWTITPPADEVTLADTDHDLSITIAAEVPTGETLTVVTRTRYTDVRLSDGTDYWGEITGSSPAFWPLEPGTTAVNLALTGAAAGSKVEVAFNPRYETAL